MSISAGVNPLRIQYCIRRNDGYLVPLVAADMLPHLAELYHIPRIITAEQALEYRLSLVGPEATRPQVASTTSQASGLYTCPAGANPPGLGGSTISASPPAGLHTDGVQTYTEPELERIREVLRRGQKIWCSKWLDTRDCAFQQQGCRYKHDIPPRPLWKGLGFPQGRPWWHQAKPQDHVQRVLASLKDGAPPNDDGVGGGGGGGSNSNKGRPRVPIVSNTESPVPAVSSAYSATRALGEANASKQQQQQQQQQAPAEDVCLIDFDDEIDAVAKSSPSPEAQAPALKKVKTEPELELELEQRSGSTIPSASAVRTFVPAGESTMKHVAAARLHHRRCQAQCTPRSKRKDS